MIEIAMKLRPFSRLPGASALLPRTDLVLQAFPTLIRIKEATIAFALTGPMREFTFEQDLEREAIRFLAKAKEGYVRLLFQAKEAKVVLTAERTPDGGLFLFYKGEKKRLKRGESLTLEEGVNMQLSKHIERLSLGSHKALDWEKVLSRFDLCEILPVIYLLAQKIPKRNSEPLEGMFALLELPQKKGEVLEGLEKLIRAGFSSILVPRLVDTEHQGIIEGKKSGDPLFLLQEAFRRIRTLFFQASHGKISFLPLNPFESGRLIGLTEEGVGKFDLEWRKGLLRRVVFSSEMEGNLIFELGELKKFKIRKGKEKGQPGRCLEPFFVEKGKKYLFDSFQK